jgi:hypothetical protein
MSLRARLTILYSSLVGGILLLFGVVVYQLVSINLVNQIDEILVQTAVDLVDNTEFNAIGGLDMASEPEFELATNVYIQLWERDAGLRFASASILHLRAPLAPLDRWPAAPIYRNVNIGAARLRVLSVPLSLGNRVVGTLQVGVNLAFVEATQKALLTVLIVGTLTSSC